MIRKPKVGDELKRNDQHQIGHIISIDKDGKHVVVDWPYLK